MVIRVNSKFRIKGIPSCLAFWDLRLSPIVSIHIGWLQFTTALSCISHSDCGVHDEVSLWYHMCLQGYLESKHLVSMKMNFCLALFWMLDGIHREFQMPCPLEWWQDHTQLTQEVYEASWGRFVVAGGGWTDCWTHYTQRRKNWLKGWRSRTALAAVTVRLGKSPCKTDLEE